MNYSRNASEETLLVCSFGLSFKVSISILFVMTFVLCISENVLISLVICLDKKLRKPSNGYLLSLALTDISTSLSLIPLEMIYVWCYPEWPLGSAGTDTLNGFWLFCLVSPFVTVLMITVDRFKAVTTLARYRDVVSWQRTLLLIGLMWMYCILVVGLMCVFALQSTTGESYEWNVKYKFYYSFLGLHLVLPLLIICILYFKIYKKAVNNRRELLMVQGQVHLGGKSYAVPEITRETRLEVKMAKTVGFVILFLVIVWIPILILEGVYATQSHSCVVEQLGVASVWLTCSNGVINPIVYSLRNQDFKRAIWQLIQLKKPRSRSV